MAELGQAQVYSPKPLQAWRSLLNWLAFFYQIIVQILRGTPSFSQLFSFVGFRQFSFLSSSSSSSPSSSSPSSSASFKPLPVQLPLTEPLPDHVSAADDDSGDAVDKLTVVLDLDETLVCAYETSSLPAIVRNQAAEAGLKWFELECVSVDREGEGKQKVNHVTVFERPGLQEFLQQISKFADLVLFTAGLEGYARPLVDRIDLENRFSCRLYRPATITTKYREHVKDLSCLSKDLNRTVIVDNNPFSFLLQPMNGIPCIPFSAGRPHDEQLIEVLLPLLKHLSLQKDVRPVLYERFRMPEWFQKHGIPAADSTV